MNLLQQKLFFKLIHKTPKPIRMKNILFILFSLFASIQVYAQNHPDEATSKLNNFSISRLLSRAEKDFNSDNKEALKLTLLAAKKALKVENMEQFANANELLGKIYIYRGNMDKAQKSFEISFNFWESMQDTIKMGFCYGYLGELYYAKCNYSKAEEYYQKGFELKKQIKDSINYSYNLNAIGNIHLETCHYKDALSYYFEALKFNIKNKSISGICYSQNGLGNTYFEMNDLNSAKIYFDKALSIGKEHQLYKNVAYSLNQLAKLQNALGNRNTAIDLYNESLEISKTLLSKSGIAQSYMGIGEVYQSIMQNDKALEFNHKALKIFEKIDSKKNIASCYLNIGMVLYEMKDPEMAKENFRKSIEINEQIGYKKGAAEGYRKVGNTLYQEEKYDESLFEYNKSLNIQKSIGNQKGIASCFTNIGLINIKEHKLLDAERYLNKSIEINTVLENLGGVASAYNNLAELYRVQKHPQKAIQYLLNSYKIASDMNRITLKAESAKNLSEIYSSENNFEKSLNYHQIYFNLYNQMYNAQLENRIGWIQMQNERDKRISLEKIFQNEKAIEKEKLNTQSLINSFLIIIVIIILLSTTLIYGLYVAVKKANKKLTNEVEVRKKTESLLADHQKNLEGLVKIRTVELEKAKNKAEESDRLKSSFLANMSHEVRTPMNAIIGFSKLLTMTSSPEKQRNYTSIINDNGYILLTLVNDIIDISMIESKQLKIKKNVFKLHPILLELKSMFDEQKKLDKKDHIEIRIDIAEEVKDISIYSDPVRIKQILINLLRNALKFTETGVINFGVELYDENCCFFVKDTGIGIPLEEQNLIYDRFRQASNNTVEHGGTGLGLTISKSLTEILGGKIWFVSHPEKGSQFNIELPFQNNTTQNIVNSSSSGKRIDLSGKNILVAEDTKSNFLYIKEVLRKTNANITWSQDGIETVEKFKANNFDLVLMDVHLPNINGYEVTKVLKRKKPNIPVIVQTAYDFQDELKNKQESGFDAFITKPYTQEQLLEIIFQNLS